MESRVEFYEKAINLGNTSAMFNIGLMILENKFSYNLERAIELFKKASKFHSFILNR